MRFFGRSLLLGILAALIAVSSFAQDAVPVTIHPNSRSFLSDTALIVMDNDQQQTFDTIRQAVEAADGHVIIYAKPSILLVQLSDDGVAPVGLAQGVRVITKSPFDPATVDITDPNALLAVNYFNWVVSGHADADMDRPSDGSLESAVTAPSDLIAADSATQAAAVASGVHSTLGTSVLVNLVFLSGGTQNWNAADQSTAYNNTVAAMSWWNSRILQHFGVSRPSTVPFFSIRTYSVTINTTPGEANQSAHWANAAISGICNGTCSWFDSGAENRGDADTNVNNWNIATRQAANMNDSFTGFLVRGDVSVGGAVAGGFTHGLGGPWWAIGQYVLDYPDIPAHETGHVYWACDEYDDAGLSVHPSCAGCGGPRNALNSNADSSATNSCVIPEHRHICIMKTSGSAFSVLGNDIDDEYLKVCPYTRIQINWWSDNSCYNDVNWNVPSRGPTHWEGTYWSDSHAPRMPLVHWSGGPEVTRDDGGGNSLDFDFVANPVTGICLTGSSTGTRTTDFSARWRRVINFTEGEYEFHGTGDDSVQIYVDGLELKPSSTTPGTFEHVQLAAGNHTVLVDYFQTSGAATVHVDWTRITTATCNTPYIGVIASGDKVDYCVGETPTRMLVATATAGTPPYRIAIQRNGGLPVTYDMPFRNFYFTPQIVGGDSHYTLVSMVDANGCPAQVIGNGVDINFDSTTPRINGGFRPGAMNGCSLPLQWDAATSCDGSTVRYTLKKAAVRNGNLVNTTLLTCSSQLSFTDNDVQNSSLTYTLTAIAGDCSSGGKRNYPQINMNVTSCPTSVSVIATANVSGIYGDQPTLSAHLTGNNAAIPNRNIVFEVNGVSAGSGVTDSNGDAHSTATLNFNPGTYTGGLTVRFEGDDAWYGASASADVVVQPSCYPAAIVTQPSASTINLGASATLSVSVTGTSPISVVWYTGNTRLGSGTSITVTPTWTTQYYALVTNPCVTVQTRTVTVTVRQPATITWATPAAITYGTALSATQLNATADTPGTFTYTPAAGTVLAAGTQTLSVSFAPNDTNQYLTTTATRSIVVQKATPAVTWATPSAITYGTALSATQLNATASVAGTFTYTPAAGTVLGAGSQTLSLTFTPTDTASYNTVTTTRALTVNKANPTGSWPTPAPITYGTPLSSTQLNGVSDIPGTIVYSPPAGTILNAGTQTLTATFTPNDTANYNVVSGTVSLVVNKASQTITWATPDPIATGAAVSSTQLNATVSVVGPAAAGALTYDVASGTVLSAGDHNVTATAAATANYNSASRTVVFHVCAFPAITAQPQGTVIAAGGSAHLTLTATNYSTVTWYKADGTQVGTGSPYVSISTTTSYYAIVTNSCTSVRSANVTITVCAPPTITTQPASFNIVQGQPATLSIGVAALTADQIQGGGSLYIHWFNASGDVLVGTGNDLAVYPSATTTYYARVGNGCGEVRSSNMTLGVAIPACGLPVINSQSADVTIADGTSTTLSVDVSSFGGTSYQWYINGVANGANGEDVTNGPEFDTGILSTNGSEFDVTYRFYVVVTNSCGSVRSNDFVVTVTNTSIGGD